MEETLVPDWIKKIKAEDELSKAKSEARSQREAEARSLIRAEGVDFWKQLLKDLQISVDGLEVLNIRGSLAIVGNVEAEQNCRVLLARKGIIPSQTYTDLFYSRGGMQIRCYAMEGPLPFLELCVTDENRVAAMSDDQFTPMNSEQAAQLIVERMVGIVRN